MLDPAYYNINLPGKMYPQCSSDRLFMEITNHSALLIKFEATTLEAIIFDTVDTVKTCD